MQSVWNVEGQTKNSTDGSSSANLEYIGIFGGKKYTLVNEKIALKNYHKNGTISRFPCYIRSKDDIFETTGN